MCNTKENIAQYVIRIEGMWPEFANLGASKDKTTKKAALLRGIQDVFPSTFEHLITQPDLKYEEMK